MLVPIVFKGFLDTHEEIARIKASDVPTDGFVSTMLVHDRYGEAMWAIVMDTSTYGREVLLYDTDDVRVRGTEWGALAPYMGTRIYNDLAGEKHELEAIQKYWLV